MTLSKAMESRLQKISTSARSVLGQWRAASSTHHDFAAAQRLDVEHRAARRELVMAAGECLLDQMPQVVLDDSETSLPMKRL
jgi:hypothetical protein